MDPNRAWRELADAYQAQELDQCVELAEGLVQWLAKDGYPPTITRHQAFDRHVVKSACEAILAEVAG